VNTVQYVLSQIWLIPLQAPVMTQILLIIILNHVPFFLFYAFNACRSPDSWVINRSSLRALLANPTSRQSVCVKKRWRPRYRITLLISIEQEYKFINPKEVSPLRSPYRVSDTGPTSKTLHYGDISMSRTF
jgi:hypothetical protein